MPLVINPDGSATVQFTEGVAETVSVASLLPATADRYHGGWFALDDPPSGGFAIYGTAFDPAAKTLSYDGMTVATNPAAVNPSPHDHRGGFWLGSEVADAGSHWQWPPTCLQIPYPRVVNGAMLHVAVDGVSKHTRARFCPFDGLIYVFGGDYAHYGMLNGMPQDGDMTFWRYDPLTADQVSAWSLAYPWAGRPGEDVPVDPDIMGFSWDPTRQIWWITWGDARGSGRALYVQSGGLANAWPVTVQAPQLDSPVFTFDPKLPEPKFTKLLYMPFDTSGAVQKFRENAYDDVSKRLYTMSESSDGIKIWWLDTTPYDTDPSALAWASADIPLGVGKPANLTGGNFQFPLIHETPIHCDVTGRLIYFLDSVQGAVLGLTLPGHPSGEHNVKLIGMIPGWYNLASIEQGYLAGALMPFIWVPEHRSVVIMAEPEDQEGGPQSTTTTINVDTGVVSPGPRWPQNPKDGLPYFCNSGAWCPKTDEIVLHAFLTFLDNKVNVNRSWTKSLPATGNMNGPNQIVRYKWVP